MKINNQFFLKNITLLLLLKLFACAAVFKFLSLYDSRIFSYTDLNYYNSNLNVLSANYFFSLFVKFIGYDLSSIYDFNYLLLSFTLSSLFVLPYVYLSTKYLKRSLNLFFICALSFHPYLALYSLKLDTSLFGILAISIFTIFILEFNNRNYSLSFFVVSFTTLFRNSILPFAWINFIILFKKKLIFTNILKVINFISICIISFTSFSQFNYGIDSLSQNYGCYSISNIKVYLSEIFGNSFSDFLAYLITPIIHLILDLGAREAIYINCLNLNQSFASNSYVNFISTIAFFSFHLFLFCSLFLTFFRHIKKFQFEFLFPLVILLPTLYGSAHMRYIIPLIPYLLFICFLRFDNEKLYFLKD